MRERIEWRGDYPLTAVIAGAHYKVYLVANLALNDGPQAAAEHYRLDLATVQAALAFYDGNEAAIHEAIQTGVPAIRRSAAMTARRNALCR